MELHAYIPVTMQSHYHAPVESEFKNCSIKPLEIPGWEDECGCFASIVHKFQKVEDGSWIYALTGLCKVVGDGRVMTFSPDDYTVTIPEHYLENFI